MILQDDDLKTLLVQESFVDTDAIHRAEAYAHTHGVHFTEYLLNQNLITRDLLGQAVAEHYDVDYIDLNSHRPSIEQVHRIPQKIAKENRVVFFKETPKVAYIASDDPKNDNAIEALQSIFKNKKIVLGYALAEDIDAAFMHYRKPLGDRFKRFIGSPNQAVSDVFSEIVDDAIAQHVSDIHFEPQTHEVIIRLRLDGVLHEAGRFDKKYYGNIVNRIKVEANLRIDEHLAVQDGAIRYKYHNQSVDLRISIAPVLEGEKVVIRVLSEYVRGFALSDLGLDAELEKKVIQAARRPYGMILVTGPTGSGKTTTLYALLKVLDRSSLNIMTIEDPVEYKIAGVNQIQVNSAAELTFAKGLRSILRQDPDAILLGEIRDNETAEIAINAALTGHLLFSTFHANNAPSAISRLFEMGIVPYQLASTLDLIIAQRLVRTICQNCRVSYVVGKDEIEKMLPGSGAFFSEKSITLYRGKGCEMCGNIGYLGRIGVFEAIEMTMALEALVMKHPSAHEVWTLACQEGAKSLYEDGINKIKAGLITPEELMRVAPPEDSNI